MIMMWVALNGGGGGGGGYHWLNIEYWIFEYFGILMFCRLFSRALSVSEWFKVLCICGEIPRLTYETTRLYVLRKHFWGSTVVVVGTVGFDSVVVVIVVWLGSGSLLFGFKLGADSFGFFRLSRSFGFTYSVPNSQDDVEVNLGLIYTVLVDIQHDLKHSGTPIISYCIVSYSEPAWTTWDSVKTTNTYVMKHRSFERQVPNRRPHSV